MKSFLSAIALFFLSLGGISIYYGCGSFDQTQKHENTQTFNLQGVYRVDSNPERYTYSELQALDQLGKITEDSAITVDSTVVDAEDVPVSDYSPNESPTANLDNPPKPDPTPPPPPPPPPPDTTDGSQGGEMGTRKISWGELKKRYR